MECGLKSLTNGGSSPRSTSLTMACRRPFPQPPLLPLQRHLQASPPPADLRAKKPRQATAATPSPKKPAASAPMAAPSPSRTREVAEDWTSMYSVSPPPSSVPMPTSLLLATAGGRKKAPTPCAVEVAGGGVDVGATDELRRLLRL